MEEKKYISKELGGIPLYGGYYLRGISINIDDYDFEYMCHVSYTGDTDWNKGGTYMGINTEDARIEGVAFRNTNFSPSGYKIQYRAYMSGKGWTNWCENGTFCGTKGESRALMAVEVKVVEV